MRERNIKLVQSTPSEYLKAIQAERKELKVYHGDFFPFLQSNGDSWTGYFSSSPGFKGAVRHSSALMHAQNKKFALKALQKDLKQDEVQSMMKAGQAQLDFLGLANNQD
jgi:hypothetical protein